ncbi:MAG TPA: NTP transferase domain-containing protein [Anaerolineae bacterium]|nr:NTP transferase domain-containing protein [Anaerolineae bacterium]
MMDYTAVIMAGGGGTRLWPLSRRTRPKQSLHLFGDRTLFQMAVDRIMPIMTPERIFIVTVADQAKILEEQTPSIPKKNFILEPAPRGTASVVGLAAIILHQQNPNCVMAVLTADHYIADVERFQDLLLASYEVACDDELVTLGITPRYPDTGYGYIQRGDMLGQYRGYHACRVKTFKEKPDLSQAEEYLASGDYAWNSGMFVWKVSRILEEIEQQMPNLYDGLKKIENALGSSDEGEIIEEVWSGLKSKTIDYGVMEGAKQVTVIPADDLGWWDVGGWNRLFELMELDEMGNLIRAPKTLILDTKDTLIYQDPMLEKERLIATLGIEGLIAIDTGDVLLLCQRERAEDLRRLVKELKILNLDEYL